MALGVRSRSPDAARAEGRPCEGATAVSAGTGVAADPAVPGRALKVDLLTAAAPVVAPADLSPVGALVVDATAPAVGFDGGLLLVASEGDGYSARAVERLSSANPRYAALIVPGSAHGTKLLGGGLWEQVLAYASGNPPA